jgi:hypothetical protein
MTKLLSALALAIVAAATLVALLLTALFAPFILLMGGGYGSGGGSGNMAVVQAAEAMAPAMRLGPPDNYDVAYDASAPIMQQAIAYWSAICPGCGDWQNGELQCTMFAAAAYALAGQALPNTNLNAVDYWPAYAHLPGWVEIPSGTGLPNPGDLVIWSSPFFGGVGHMAVVTQVVPSPDGVHNGSLQFAEGNGPGALITFPLQPNLQIIPWKAYTTLGYIRNIRYSNGGNASQSLVRISQLDPAQYNSTAEYATWAYSACSTASMTEIMNAYGRHYRIHDVLVVEAARGDITPQLGLLSPGGIADTVAQFGFHTPYWGNTMTLDQVIAAANQGTPVIVSFPPDRYAGGHILVVIGGDAANVRLADSSGHDYLSLTHMQFLQWWGGFAAIVVP